MLGDTVLTEAAARLQTLFPAGDVLSRFGGDEFLVFSRDVCGGTLLEELAEKIVEQFHGVCAEELGSHRVSCSVGVSRCPADGADFQTLFQRCDRALYQAKQDGKDRIAFYDGDCLSSFFGMDARQMAAAGTRIESGGPAAGEDGIIPRALRLMHQSGGAEEAVNAVLELVGKRFDVSRVYIFEDSEDGTWCKNTFEWCGEGVQPQIGNLQQVFYADMGEDYRRHFDENGVFYCPDVSQLAHGHREILEAQGIRSLLQCAVWEDGAFRCFVGIDDCRVRRTWTQEQIGILEFITDILTTFLMRRRAENRAQRAVRNLRMVLDNQNAWIYVIDPDSYELCYINAKTKRTVPDAREGMTCYQAFFHRDAPCGKCPAKGIRKTGNQTMEIYNPALDTWSMADACLIRWEDRDACMLACVDISPYKTALEEGKPQRRSPSPGDTP